MKNDKKICTSPSYFSSKKSSIKLSIDMNKVRKNSKSPYIINQCKSYIDLKKLNLDKSLNISEKAQKSLIYPEGNLKTTKTETSTRNYERCFQHSKKNGKYTTGSVILCSKCALQHVKNGIFVYELLNNGKEIPFISEKSTNESILHKISGKKEDINISLSILKHQKEEIKSKIDSKSQFIYQEINKLIYTILMKYQEYKIEVKKSYKSYVNPLNNMIKKFSDVRDEIFSMEKELIKNTKLSTQSENEIKNKVKSLKVPEINSANPFDIEISLEESKESLFKKIKTLCKTQNLINENKLDSPQLAKDTTTSKTNGKNPDFYISFENKEQLFKKPSNETPRKQNSGRSQSETQWKMYFQRVTESTEKKKWNQGGKGLYSSLNEDSALFGKYLKPN